VSAAPRAVQQKLQKGQDLRADFSAMRPPLPLAVDMFRLKMLHKQSLVRIRPSSIADVSSHNSELSLENKPVKHSPTGNEMVQAFGIVNKFVARQANQCHLFLQLNAAAPINDPRSYMQACGPAQKLPLSFAHRQSIVWWSPS
jgi:hypothetical protein